MSLNDVFCKFGESVVNKGNSAFLTTDAMIVKVIEDIDSKIKNKKNEIKDIECDIAIMNEYKMNLYNELNYLNNFDSNMLEIIDKAIHEKDKKELKKCEEHISGMTFGFRDKIKVVDFTREYNHFFNIVRYIVYFKVKGIKDYVFFIRIPSNSYKVNNESEIEYKNYSFGLKKGKNDDYIIDSSFDYSELRHRFMDYINNKEYMKGNFK